MLKSTVECPCSGDDRLPGDSLGEQVLTLTETAGVAVRLPDLTLDISGVTQPTPGLIDLARAPIAAIVHNVPEYWGETVPTGAGDCLRTEDFDDGESGGPVGNGPPCTMTVLRLRNLLNEPVRVTARTAAGGIVTRNFKPRQALNLRLLDAMGKTVPGGLGRCVTIDVEVENGLGQQVLLARQKICCDKNKAGDIIAEAPPPGPFGTTVPRLRNLLQVVRIR